MAAQIHHACSKHRKDSLAMAETETTATPRYSSDPDPVHTEAVSSRLNLSPLNGELPLEERGQEALRLAQEAFTQTGSWVVFYREMLGAEGVVRKLFTESSEMRFFEKSTQFVELQEMVAAMRSQDASKGDSTEPERMITIRLPKSLHDALTIEAEEMNLSINKLCISKLLQRIESRFIPIQQGRRRGRRPGPQGPRKTAGDQAQLGGAPS
jgi:predicted HicB family RNase H-like nuclease